MDTTKKYLKMCEKAAKLQELTTKSYDEKIAFHVYDGPYVPVVIFEDYSECFGCHRPNQTSRFCPDCGGKVVPTNKYYISWGGLSDQERKYRRFFWLFPQDYLQGLVKVKSDKNYDWQCHLGMLESFTIERSVHGDSFSNYVWDLETWEQLWLAFVKKVNYGELWDGETWQPEKKVVASSTEQSST